MLCRKHRRARRIIVHVSAARGIWVTLPFYQGYRDAENVVRLHKRWIERTLKTVTREYQNAQPLRDKLAVIGVPRAKEELTIRLGELARQHGFCFRRVSVRSQRTRWGSCSSRQCISLNVRLMLLPGDLRDYVMLHELVHTQVHNHSPAFYDELDRVAENRRFLASNLKRISLNAL